MRLSLVSSLAFIALCADSVFASSSSLSTIVNKDHHYIGSYWPAYYSKEIQGPKAFPWHELGPNRLAYYFVAVTKKWNDNDNGHHRGFEIGPGQSQSDVEAFTNEAKRHGAKALVSIGGWSGSTQFGNLVASRENREWFAREIHEFLDEYRFDGVDLDWEYPASQGIGCNSVRKTDSANFLKFLAVLRRRIGRRKLITAAVATTPFVGPDGDTPLADVSQFAKYLDFVNLMTYDISGSWSETTGPLSPLRSCGADSSVMSAVEAWSNAGFPRSRINVGVPSYATSWTTESHDLATTTVSVSGGGKFKTRLFQNFTSIPKGDDEDVKPTTDECGNVSNSFAGSWKYFELVEQGMLSADRKRGGNGFERYFDECTATPFLFNSRTRTLISYNDAESAHAVAEFARKKKLAGVFVFDSVGFKDSPRVYKAIRQGLGDV